MSSSEKNRPVYALRITSALNTKQINYNAGVAFQGKYGRLRIVLNPGVTLRWDDEVYLTLHPYEDFMKAKRGEFTKGSSSDERREASQEPPPDDGLPF
jgi:hypothetical protein